MFQNHRRGRLTVDESDMLVAEALRLIQLRVELLPLPSSLVAEAYAFAKSHNLSAIYDSLYLVPARALDAELWTDDRRLLAAVSTTAPWVRWIGDYPTL